MVYIYYYGLIHKYICQLPSKQVQFIVYVSITSNTFPHQQTDFFSGTLNYSAIDTCAFNKPPSGNISNTYNIFLKWDYGLYETDISMYTIWRLMKFESFFEKEWQLIASVSILLVINFL